MDNNMAVVGAGAMTLSIIDASIPQVNAREKVLRLAQYVGDIKMASMLHGKVLRSPYPHARIVHVDTSRARALHGVKVVVTGDDTPTRRWGLIRKEHRILAAGKVRFAGEEVAAVAAVDESIALDALELIRVELAAHYSGKGACSAAQVNPA